MKTTLTVLAVLLVVALFYYRQRIYLRDPLATVYRSDVPEAGVEVFINYSNDVLLWQEAEPNPYRILLQAWNRTPGTPMTITCLHWVACFTDSDRTSTIPLTATGNPKPNSSTRHGANPPPAAQRSAGSRYDPNVFMSSRQVLFTAPDGAAMRIQLR